METHRQTILRMKSNLHHSFTTPPRSFALFHRIFFQFITEHVCLSPRNGPAKSIYIAACSTLLQAHSSSLFSPVVARALTPELPLTLTSSRASVSIYREEESEEERQMQFFRAFFFTFFNTEYMFFSCYPQFYAISIVFFSPVVFVCRFIQCHSVSVGVNEQGFCCFYIYFLCISSSLFNGCCFAAATASASDLISNECERERIQLSFRTTLQYFCVIDVKLISLL